MSATNQAGKQPLGSNDPIVIESVPILVNVRWFDGYLEVFECSEFRQGGQIMWMRLENGENRTIPLREVRWFSVDPESHAEVREDVDEIISTYGGGDA